MDNFNKIQNLDLKEAVRRTQIEYDFLEALVQKDFATLQRFNVRGFLKILSKEYDIDFTEFMEEFDAYLEENASNLKPASKTIIIPKLDAYASKNSGLWQWFIGFIIVGVIGGGVYYYDVISLISNKAGIANSEESTPLQNGVVVVDNQSIQKDMQENDNALVLAENAEDNLIEQNASKEQEQVLENNTSAPTLFAQNTDQNIENNISQEDVNIQEELVKPKFSEAQFASSDKIWVGFIDIKTLKKTSLVKNKKFSVNLVNGGDRLMVIGTNAITMIDENGNEFKYPAGKLKRFIIRDNTIRNIDLAEFAKYNKGKGW
ncbi:hypothetical protein [Campylobacter sp. US33a]|uniref:Phosphatidylglycerophosphate synthase n=1 Tax=Campylobacter sp. CCS1377 TaxID=3158229 RepID=A0AAU7E5W7_9BACT|nr:hypothetical protein [Campylobacter sp. US33a]MCW1359809.1 hypothetical protein [Campylobacter jejuni]TEY03074.1 hypothetical protein ELQ16_03770 [Campylobacter sp. US33a]